MSSASSKLAAPPAGAAPPLRPETPISIHPSLVLGAYLEPLVRGRRVAVLGDARIGLAERLIERGARLVHAYDPEPARVAEALARVAPGRGPHPAFAVLEGDLGVRDGAFDAVVIPDLSAFADPADALRRARRLVSEGGAAVIASPNPDAPRALLPQGEAQGAGRRPGPDYYALYDLVSLQFRVVRMLGQAPFVGYTIADFAQDGEPEVSIDTSLLTGSEEPEQFIALASERPVRLDPFSVVEIPLADLPAPAAAGGASAAALDEAARRASALEEELSDLRLRMERELETEEARAAARAEAASATHARIADLEAELAERGARLKDVEARAGDAHVRAERNGHKIRDLEEELRAQRDRAARLAKQLDDEKKARTKVELELGMIRNKPEIAGAKDRIDALSAELDAARARIAELEARPAVPPRAAPDPALMLRVEELEAAVTTAKREIARITGERDAARGRVEELGRALEEQRRLAVERQEALAAEAQRARAAEEQRRADEQRRLAAERQEALAAEAQRARAAEEQRRAADEQRRAAEEQRRAADEQRRAAEALRAQVEALRAQIEGLEREKAQLLRRNEELDRQKGDLQRSDASEVVGAEIAALEEALRERGKVIAALQAELRESERVGKELVDELGELFEASIEAEGTGAAGSGQGGPAGGGELPPRAGAAKAEGAEALRRQLDTLAHSAARAEADLHAATWRVAQLERELIEARAAAAQPPERTEPSPAVAEQAILLQQVAGAAP